MYLLPIEVGQSVRLNNLFFDFNKSELNAESYSELDRVVAFLGANTQVEIEVAGHTG